MQNIVAFGQKSVAVAASQASTITTIAPLSQRQTEVVFWLAQGKTVADVAVILGRSEKTVECHLTHAMQKLQICTRAELTYEAIRLGIVPCPCRPCSVDHLEVAA
jgi:DNA-binding NarL/FixJ family response regulator